MQMLSYDVASTKNDILGFKGEEFKRQIEWMWLVIMHTTLFHHPIYKYMHNATFESKCCAIESTSIQALKQIIGDPQIIQ